MVGSVVGMLAAHPAGVKRPKRVESRVVVHITAKTVKGADREYTARDIHRP
jgi:hypothetical protein